MCNAASIIPWAAQKKLESCCLVICGWLLKSSPENTAPSKFQINTKLELYIGKKTNYDNETTCTHSYFFSWDFKRHVIRHHNGTSYFSQPTNERTKHQSILETFTVNSKITGWWVN